MTSTAPASSAIGAPITIAGLWRRVQSLLPPHLVVMGAIFLGALGVGYVLLPDDNERIAMLERDGHDKQALEILEQRFAAGDRNQRTLFQLQNLYEERGDLPRARRMLELLAAARPRDANVQRHLAEFYRSTQDEAGYIRALETRLSNRYSQPVCKELIGLYRRAGAYEDEQRTIRACRIKGYRRPDDIIRLAHLVAADGKLAETAVLLKSVDDRRRLRGDRDRLLLFAALLEAGNAEEAKRRAGRWFKGSKDRGLVLQIIDTLADQNRHDLALDLAREVGKPGDSISLAVAELMLDRDQIVAAASYLRGWLETAKLVDPDIVARVVHAALDAEDPMLAYLAGELYGLKRLTQPDLVALAEALSAIDEKAAFQAVKAVIAPGQLKDNALLAAAVEVDLGKPEPARQLLSRVQVKALDEWRLALWARLMTSTGRRATAEQTLREIAAEVSSAAARTARPLPSAAPPQPPGATGGAAGVATGGGLTSPSPVPRPSLTATGHPAPAAAPASGTPSRLIRKNKSRKANDRRQRRQKQKRGATPVRKAPVKNQQKAPALQLPTPVPFPAPG